MVAFDFAQGRLGHRERTTTERKSTEL